MLISLILAASMAWAGCDAPTRVEELAAAAPKAQIAMASLDSAGFAEAVTGARSILPCLGQPLTPLDAAGYHGLEALDAFSEGSSGAATLSFAAATAALPDFRLPAMIAPPEGDLDALLARAKKLPPSEMQALPPYGGIVLVDGTRSLARPTGRPCVLQLVGGNGTVRATYYLLGTDPLPAWDPPPTALQRILPEPRQRPSVPFAVAAGTTAFAAGGLYALGGMYHAQYVDPTTPYGDLPGIKTKVNVSLGGSIALSTVAAALTTFTFLRW